MRAIPFVLVWKIPLLGKAVTVLVGTSPRLSRLVAGANPSVSVEGALDVALDLQLPEACAFSFFLEKSVAGPVVSPALRRPAGANLAAAARERQDVPKVHQEQAASRARL